MKLRITLDIEIPDSVNIPFLGTQYEEASLIEIIDDNVIGYSGRAHLHDAVKWMTKEPPELPDTTQWEQGRKQIVAVHDTWAEILLKTKFTVEKVV